MAIIPTSSNSREPANADNDSAGASHHGKPSCMTSRPSAIPNGKMPSPAENESLMPAKIWARRPVGARIAADAVSWVDSGMPTMIANFAWHVVAKVAQLQRY